MSHLILMAPLALAALAGLAWLKHVKDRHGAGPLLWRWHSGMPHDGSARTNATWLHRSSDVLHYTGHATWWHHLPRLARAGIRCGAELAALALLAGLALAPGVTVPAAAVALAASLAFAAWYGWRHWHGIWFHIRWVRPLRRTLELRHGIPPESLKIARDRSRVRLSLPPGWAGTQRERDLLTAIVTSGLRMKDIDDPGWREGHRRPHVMFQMSPPPPDRVELADPRVQSAIAALEPGYILPGLGRKGAEIVRSVKSEAPMVAVSMRTGAGKSVTSGLVAATLGSQGSILAIADCKLTSHRWAKGLPNVAYASRIWQIHDLLIWLETEVQRRNDLIDRYADIDGLVTRYVGDPVAFLIEELNTLQKWLARYWRQRRAADRDLPAKSPAVDALDTLLCISRAAAYTGILIAQRLSAAATSGAGGNADARENVCLKWLCDPGLGTWRMLGNDSPCPQARNHPGRYQLVDPAEVTEVQGVFATNRELRALATSGVIADPPAGMPFVSRAARPQRDDDGWAWRAEVIPVPELVAAGGPTTSWQTRRTGPGLHPVPHPVLDARLVGEDVQAGVIDDLVTLKEADQLGITKVNLIAARRRSTRDRRHPASAGKRGRENLYDAADLADYYARAT